MCRPKGGQDDYTEEESLNAVTANHPEVQLLVLLVDERPEEVTDMVRSGSGHG